MIVLKGQSLASLFRTEETNLPGDCSHKAYPQQYYTRYTLCILPVEVAWRAMLGSTMVGLKYFMCHLFCRAVSCNRNLLHRDNDRHSQSVRERADGDHNGRYSPGEPNSFRFVSLRPKEVEEEARAKYSCNSDADEDVVGCYPDPHVIVDVSSGKFALNFIFLGHVV
jgi:hypothetical protein